MAYLWHQRFQLLRQRGFALKLPPGKNAIDMLAMIAHRPLDLISLSAQALFNTLEHLGLKQLGENDFALFGACQQQFAELTLGEHHHLTKLIGV